MSPVPTTWILAITRTLGPGRGSMISTIPRARKILMCSTTVRMASSPDKHGIIHSGRAVECSRVRSMPTVERPIHARQHLSIPVGPGARAPSQAGVVP